MRIERMRRGAATVLRLSGEVDEAGEKTLRTALVKCMSDGSRHVVLEMSGVAFISFKCIGVLLERLRQFQSSNGDLVLAGLNRYAEHLLRLAGVHSLFRTFDTETQALQVFQEAA